jgi:hypothetical protein
MMENLIGKLIILEFRKADGRTFRMICWLRAIEGGLLKIESPSKHQISYISIASVVEAGELPKEQIDPKKVNP